MSVKVEKLDNNQAKFTIEASKEAFEEAIQKAYNHKKKSISMPGFRKGKVTRQMIEKTYGKEFFYDDAINYVIQDTYYKAVEESDVEVVSTPEIDVEQVGEGQALIYTATVTTVPEVILGEYKGIEVPVAKAEVSEDEMNQALQELRDKNARIINIDDRPVEDGDDVIIDYEGFVDDIAFDGGKDTEHTLTIGSNTFIPGFEEQIIGKQIGDEFDVNVTFPVPYHSAELEGKDAVFKVKLNDITCKELPELNDELAEEATEFDTLEEYKNDILEKMSKSKEEEAKRKKEDNVIQKIIENATFDLPQVMIDNQARKMAEELAQRMQYQGLTLEQYFMFTGQSQEQFEDGLKEQAKIRISSRLVLEAIAKAEDIQVSDEDIENEMQEVAKAYQLDLERVRETMGEKERKNFVKDIAVQKAATLVADAAVEVESAEEDVTEA